MRTSFLLVLFALAPVTVLPAQTADLRLELSATTARSGDPVTLDVYVDNPNALLLAGYQIMLGWDTDMLDMAGPPALTPNSVLTDLFSTNAPPFGSGWSSCPSAGDDVGREALFALSVALSTSNQFNGATGNLFQVPFTAGQAGTEILNAFTLDEFSSCIGQRTIVADPTGNDVTGSFTDTSLEITPNLAVSGSFTLGGSIVFDLHEQGGISWALAVSLVPATVDLGSLGMLYFDHQTASFTVLGSGLADPSGSTLVPVAIPSLPMLSGRTVYAQALTGDGATFARKLSNLASFVIQ